MYLRMKWLWWTQLVMRWIENDGSRVLQIDAINPDVRGQASQMDQIEESIERNRVNQNQQGCPPLLCKLGAPALLKVLDLRGVLCVCARTPTSKVTYPFLDGCCFIAWSRYFSGGLWVSSEMVGLSESCSQPVQQDKCDPRASKGLVETTVTIQTLPL